MNIISTVSILIKANTIITNNTKPAINSPKAHTRVIYMIAICDKQIFLLIQQLVILSMQPH